MQIKVILKFEGISKYLINLEIIILLEICWKMKILKLNLPSNCKSLLIAHTNRFFIWGNVCFRKYQSENYQAGKCAFGEMPVWGTVLWGTIRRGTVCQGNNFGQLSVGELSGYQHYDYWHCWIFVHSFILYT